MSTATPWAALLCTFKDDLDQSPEDRFKKLFTVGGGAKKNAINYVADVSLGGVDLSGSQTFGWFTLPYNKADYHSPGDRATLIQAARQAALDAGVPLDKYFRFIVCMNVRCDLGVDFIGGNAICDPYSPLATIAQEMGHCWGLDHSRRDGSSDDYQDAWDVMSTMSAYVVEDPEDYGTSAWNYVGPGMNAWNIQRLGWLDKLRVWQPVRIEGKATGEVRHGAPFSVAVEGWAFPPWSEAAVEVFGGDVVGKPLARKLDVHIDDSGHFIFAFQTHKVNCQDVLTAQAHDNASGAEGGVDVELRPLHRRDLAGFNAAAIGGYLIEYRTKAGWDAAIPRSAVLVHRFADNHSYIMAGESGTYDLVAGDRFVDDQTAEVEVLGIDDPNLVARIRITDLSKTGVTAGPVSFEVECL